MRKLSEEARAALDAGLESAREDVASGRPLKPWKFSNDGKTRTPQCPHCGGGTEEPRSAPEYGNLMTRRCTFIASSDWCVFCRTCMLHMHITGRPTARKDG